MVDGRKEYIAQKKGDVDLDDLVGLSIFCISIINIPIVITGIVAILFCWSDIENCKNFESAKYCIDSLTQRRRREKQEKLNSKVKQTIIIKYP